MPSVAPRRNPQALPPNILDIHAPQFALPESPPKRQRRVAPARQSAPVPRQLTASEERLATWMYRRLGFRFGARALVRRYGAKAILDAVHDGIMIWQDRRYTTYEGDQRVTRVVEERIINPAIILPPAYLCHVLKGLAK